MPCDCPCSVRRHAVFQLASEAIVVLPVDDIVDKDAAWVVIVIIGYRLVEELVGFLDGSGCVGLGVIEDEEKVEQGMLKQVLVFGGLVV